MSHPSMKTLQSKLRVLKTLEQMDPSKGGYCNQDKENF